MVEEERVKLANFKDMLGAVRRYRASLSNEAYPLIAGTNGKGSTTGILMPYHHGGWQALRLFYLTASYIAK